MTEQLAISRLGHRGDGIADTADGPVYVPYTLPGETVTVEFQDQKVSATADADGRWKVVHKPMTASDSPYTMTITDPATFTEPLELKRSWVWRAGETVKP